MVYLYSLYACLSAFLAAICLCASTAYMDFVVAFILQLFQVCVDVVLDVTTS